MGVVQFSWIKDYSDIARTIAQYLFILSDQWSLPQGATRFRHLHFSFSEISIIRWIGDNHGNVR